MKTSLKKMLSLLLVLTLVFSIFASLITTASAATFSYNTGKRGTVCTSLSSKAKSYYTSSYSYSTLSAKAAWRSCSKVCLRARASSESLLW